MNVLGYKLYYFLGIGGIGMSALARFFHHHGKTVKGYDKTSTRLTGALQEEGIECHFTDDVSGMKALLSSFEKGEVLVVYTPAVPADFTELTFLKEEGYKILKRSQVLGEITKSFKTIAIGGTHGKTTTTTLVTHILRTAGIQCFSFMGGISRNYNTNLLLGDPNAKDPIVVVEADEYDRSFLTLEPFITLITSADPDHLDIYGDAAHVREGYELFAAKTRQDGVLIVKKNVDNDLNLKGNRVLYSLNLNTEYHATSIRVENGYFAYDIQSPVEPVSHVTLGLPGWHNVENSVGAVAVAQQLNVKGDVIREALRSFKGVKRRFEVRFRSPSVIFIDDYAHHPEELRATISSARQLYEGKRIKGIFQPHLFSRTRDFADEFAKSLGLLDECILMDIYPARELPIEGITSDWLLEKVPLVKKRKLDTDAILAEVAKDPGDVLLVMGAGNIDQLADKIETLLVEKNKS